MELNATGHCWVACLANYNFYPELLVGEDECRCGCSIQHSEGEHDQHIKANSFHSMISPAAQGTTLIEAYSCNIQVTETLAMWKDPKAMLLEYWIIAQSQDPAIREIKYLISKNNLKGCKAYSQDHRS